MMTYIFTIDFVLPTGPKVFAHLIPTMKKTQGLLGTLEALSIRRVFTIIELFNVVHPDTTFKYNHIVNIYA
jgi:hypothetical protein